jgi:seryl-tRNA synthetase
MPLDINLFREFQGGRPELIKESQRKRFASVELVDEIISKDEKWRLLTGSIDDMRKRRNKIQKEEVAAKMKAGQKADAEVALIKAIDEEIIQAEATQRELKIEIDKMVSKVGNIVEDGVPVSQDEDKDNVIIRKWGTPRNPTGLLNHHDLLWRIGGYEPERGSNVAGHKGYFLRDVGVLLNQAFINYGIAFLRKRQYTMIQPPFFMRKDIMAGVAQLEEFDEALYKVSGDGEEKYLIATSEQPLCGYHMDEWMEEKSLPIRYGGISTCFRKEAGSSGKDVWGIFRVHQFEKVEQFVIVEGDLEKSKLMQEEMIAAAEEFYQSLGFPYHIINIVSGALNNAAIKKYDLECWFPGYNSYRELVSCSNCTDYQSRAMGIR